MMKFIKHKNNRDICLGIYHEVYRNGNLEIYAIWVNTTTCPPFVIDPVPTKHLILDKNIKDWLVSDTQAIDCIKESNWTRLEE